MAPGKESKEGRGMKLLSPEWLFIIPLLIVAGWKYRALRLHEPLRLLLVTLLLLALTRPVARLGGGEMDVWLLIDRSDSSMEKPYLGSQETASILDRSKKNGDRVRIVDFARDAVLRDKGDPVFTGDTNSTMIGRAVDYILAQADTNRTNRLLIITDGYPTDPLSLTTEKLRQSGVTADWRLIADKLDHDYRIADVKYPSRVTPGQSFLVEFSILTDSASNAEIPWEISKGLSGILRGKAVLDKGKAVVRVTDRLNTPGASEYNIKIIPPDNDPVPLNNSASFWVETGSGSGIIIISPFADDPLVPFLRAQGMQVSLVNDPSDLHPARLSGTKLVIINNVPAAAIPDQFQKSLNFFVTEQGGGLLMCGGAKSFGAGGYFSSAIDPLLPVSMELRNEHRKLVTAISFILDRSGSMSMSTTDGRTKMDLANAGAINAVNLLSDLDYVSVHAVDSTPHSIAGMCQVGPNRAKLLNAVSRIQSMGGGIFVEEGIRAGWKELQKTDTGTRHIILFSDANDSEEPGDYAKYLAEMQKEGITLSVIALGKKSDADSALLEDMATQGGGRIFFSLDGADLPSIFAQETVSVARSAFIKDKTATKGTAGWSQITSGALAWPPVIDGYNLSYLRDGATAACLSDDEYHAPLVAFWSRGSGKAAAISFPVGGEYSQAQLDWPGYGDFIQTLSRWLMGSGSPEGFALKTRIEGQQLTLELLYSDSNIPVVAAKAPESVIENTKKGESRRIQSHWKHIEPGRFTNTLLLEEGEYIRGSVKIGDQAIPFGPIALTVNREWSMDPERKEDFLNMIRLTGGVERHDLTEIWDIKRDINDRQITPALLWAALALALIDALLTRLGITLLPKRSR